MKELAPLKLLKNRFYNDLQELYKTSPTPEQLKAMLGRGRAKKEMFEGDLVEGELEIGQIAGIIHDVKPVSKIVEDIMEAFQKAKAEIGTM